MFQLAVAADGGTEENQLSVSETLQAYDNSSVYQTTDCVDYGYTMDYCMPDNYDNYETM